MTLSPSRTADTYDYLGIIDKPKAGVTYKVRNRTTGEFEALRTLPGASAGDPETRDRFLREIRVHTRLAHPNIVAFHDCFELDGQLVMTAEYVEGHTLAELCAAGPLPVSEAIDMVSQVLCGLEEAHALGIVHRAITADHVHITPSGVVKLGGFGLAKPVADVKLTQTGALLGNPRYISPEQVMGAALDARSDVYSAGILLFQALAGIVPFDSTNDFDVMVEQVRSVPPAPGAYNSAVSHELDAVVLHALAKQPEGRFSTARAFREALAGCSVTPATPVPSAPPPALSAPQFLTAAPQFNLPVPMLAFGIASLTITLTVILYVTIH
jgi:serine/threonine protein kinase